MTNFIHSLDAANIHLVTETLIQYKEKEIFVNGDLDSITLINFFN